MRKWIARFSYTLVIIGGLLFYQVYKFQTSGADTPGWQTAVIVIGAALAVALGIQGIRMRHEMMRRDE